MTQKNQLINEIELLPMEYVNEVMDFVGYIKLKHLKNTPDTMMLSEKALAVEWDTPQEDAIWANL